MLLAMNQDFCLSLGQIQAFRRDGFVKLERVLTTEFVEHLQVKLDASMLSLDAEQTLFKRMGYDILEADPVVISLLRDRCFRKVLNALTERTLFFTQGIGFEIEKNKHLGFPWHICAQSFGFLRASDYGCSLWAPLDPIRVCGQGGGMQYVSESVISGQFMFDYVDPAIDRTLADIADAEAAANSEPSLTLDEFSELRHGILNSPAMMRLLEATCHRDDFEPGDALLFNKRVIHASEMLAEGPIARRRAFVMRFVDADARYDKRRAHALEFPRKYFGRPPQSTFHLDVCTEDGQLIADSQYFRNPEDRKLRSTHE